MRKCDVSAGLYDNQTIERIFSCKVNVASNLYSEGVWERPSTVTESQLLRKIKLKIGIKLLRCEMKFSVKKIDSMNHGKSVRIYLTVTSSSLKLPSPPLHRQ